MSIYLHYILEKIDWIASSCPSRLISKWYLRYNPSLGKDERGRFWFVLSSLVFEEPCRSKSTVTVLSNADKIWMILAKGQKDQNWNTNKWPDCRRIASLMEEKFEYAESLLFSSSLSSLDFTRIQMEIFKFVDLLDVLDIGDRGWELPVKSKSSPGSSWPRPYNGHNQGRIFGAILAQRDYQTLWKVTSFNKSVNLCFKNRTF